MLNTNKLIHIVKLKTTIPTRLLFNNLTYKTFNAFSQKQFHSHQYQSKKFNSSKQSSKTQRYYNDKIAQNKNQFNQNHKGYYEKNKSQTYQNKSYGNVNSEYWQKTIELIEQPAKIVVKALLTTQTPKTVALREVQNYLAFRNLTFEQGLRSDLGVLAVLVAINQSPHQINMQQYQSRIIDFVTLSDYELSKQIDSEMLHYFMINLNKRTNSNVQKNTRQYYRMKYNQIIKDNFENVYEKDFMLVCSHLMESLQKDHYNYITKWRCFPILELLQDKVKEIIKVKLEGSKLNEQSINKAEVLTVEFMEKFFELLSYYDFNNQQTARLIVAYLTTPGVLKLQDHNNFKIFLKAMIKLPYLQFSDNKQTVKQRLLKYLQKNYTNSSFVRSIYNSSNYYAKRYNIQLMIQQEFFKTFMSLKFQTHVLNGRTYQVLHKDELKKPIVPNFVWRLFKQEEKKILKKFILNDVIHSIYPEKISKHNLQNPDSQMALDEKRVVWSDNQSNFRIWKALDNLGHKYKKQQVLSQRQVDLLINDEIVLEIDGEGHYSYLNKSLMPATAFRNLHLLLRGYRMVVVTIYEYNFYRKTDQLQDLLKDKLQLLNRPGIMFVC